MPAIFAFAAFVLTAAALWSGKRLALRYGFADKPGGRKRHDNPVPPIGGLAILPAFLGLSWLGGFGDIVSWQLTVGVCVLLLMGAIDDARTVKPSHKFIIMLLTATFVVWTSGAQIGQLGHLFGFGMVELGFLSKGFTILCLVLLMNAVNMVDGVDGLAGGFCGLVTFWFMVVCAGAGLWDMFWTLAVLLGAIMGFLAFNLRAPWRRHATVFMGDSGSLCLGLVIGWFSITLTQGDGAPLLPVTVIWIIALPVMDAFALFIARTARGLHPFNADRRHLHHRFIDAGVSPGKTTVIMLAIVAFMALMAFVAEANNVPDVVMFGLWMVLFVLHTIGIMHPKGYTLLSRFLKVRLRRLKP